VKVSAEQPRVVDLGENDESARRLLGESENWIARRMLRP
jgi:hypothetical protein